MRPWSYYGIAGIVIELAVSVVIPLVLAPDVGSRDREPVIGMLTALVGLAPFGALAVAVSIDLSESYASHFGPAYAEIIVTEDPDRRRLLQLLVALFAATLTGLVLLALGLTPSLATAVVPAAGAFVFVTALISYVAKRLELVSADRFRSVVGLNF